MSARTFSDSSPAQCGGWQRLVTPTRCNVPPKWKISRHTAVLGYVCGLHLAPAVTEFTDLYFEVVVRAVHR